MSPIFPVPPPPGTPSPLVLGHDAAVQVHEGVGHVLDDGHGALRLAKAALLQVELLGRQADVGDLRVVLRELEHLLADLAAAVHLLLAPHLHDYEAPQVVLQLLREGGLPREVRLLRGRRDVAHVPVEDGGRGGWHKASVSDCVPLAAPIGLSPPLILTLCGPERVLVVSTEPPDDLSCLTTPGVGRPGDGPLPVPLTRGIQTHTPSPCGGCRLQH